MAAINPYIALFYTNGDRIGEYDTPTAGTRYLEYPAPVTIPASGFTESPVINFKIATTAGLKTYGNTTLTLLNAPCTNRWILSETADFAGRSWGQSLVIAGEITSASKLLYAKSRSMGPVSDSFSATNDTIDTDISVHIGIDATIIKA